ERDARIDTRRRRRADDRPRSLALPRARRLFHARGSGRPRGDAPRRAGAARPRRARRPAAAPRRSRGGAPPPGARADRSDPVAGGRGRGSCPPAAARVLAAAVPLTSSRTGLLARPAHGLRLAVHVLHRHLDRARPHPPAARKDRGGPLRAALARDDLGGRLPLPAVNTKIATLGLLAAGACAAAAEAALDYGPSHAAATAAIFAACGAPVLVGAHLLA